MADACSSGYRKKLGETYLRTVDGRTSRDPVGWWCTAGDVTQWRLAVMRIRTAIKDVIEENQELSGFPSSKLKKRVASWVLSSLKVPSGSIPKHLVVRYCEEDVSKAMNFARRGVGLLGELHCEAQNKGGTVPDPPPESRKGLDTGLPGPDWAWAAGAGLLGLGLLAVLRSQR